jgi:hypothetical protein
MILHPVKFFTGSSFIHFCIMKWQTIISSLQQFLFNNRRVEALQMLKQQRFLLHQGLETTAEIMETMQADEQVGSLLPVRLWIKMRNVDGSFMYLHTHSMIMLKNIPEKGQIVHIKYLPENPSNIVILS